MSAGSGSRLPCQSTSTCTPASRVVAASRSMPARPGAGPSGACPGPGSGSARRSPVTIRRSPDSVSLLVASMAARASRASSGRASKTRRPAPAWIAMMPMLCATMSCSSRAIRSRSAIAVWAAAWARTSSARACACRIEFPMSQAMIVTRRGTAIVAGATAGATVPPGCIPERALPGAGSAGRRRPWLRQSPRPCGCVSPLCSRSRGPPRRRPRPAGHSAVSAMLATDPPSITASAVSGLRRSRRAEASRAQPSTGNPHMIMAPPACRGMLTAAIVAVSAAGSSACGRMPGGRLRHRAMGLRADAARLRTAASCGHGRDDQD